MNLPHKALVLVADGRKMLFLRNEGDATIADLRVEEHREQDNPSDRDQSSDAPGRASSPVGAHRAAMGETDFHQLQEDRFAAEAADLLRKRALQGDYESLIIVAPPNTLGEMRKKYHPEVKARLLREYSKDLTGHPIPQIEKLLTS